MHKLIIYCISHTSLIHVRKSKRLPWKPCLQWSPFCCLVWCSEQSVDWPNSSSQQELVESSTHTNKQNIARLAQTAINVTTMLVLTLNCEPRVGGPLTANFFPPPLPTFTYNHTQAYTHTPFLHQTVICKWPLRAPFKGSPRVKMVSWFWDNLATASQCWWWRLEEGEPSSEILYTCKHTLSLVNFTQAGLHYLGRGLRWDRCCWTWARSWHLQA